MTAPEELSAFIRKYADKGDEKLADAERKLIEERYDSVVEHAYDAMEYRALACIAKSIMKQRAELLLPRRHGTTVTLFGKLFVETGLIDKRFGRLLGQWLPMRRAARYGVREFSKKEAEKALVAAKEFFERTKKLLE